MFNIVKAPWLLGSLFVVGFTTFSNAVLSAESVKAIALFNDRAMLSVDGKKAKIIRAGSTYFGVKLVSSNTSEATVLINGKRETLNLNSALVLSESLASKAPKFQQPSVQLEVNEHGFFQAAGNIEGKSITFLVDTCLLYTSPSPRD